MGKSIDKVTRQVMESKQVLDFVDFALNADIESFKILEPNPDSRYRTLSRNFEVMIGGQKIEVYKSLLSVHSYQYELYIGIITRYIVQKYGSVTKMLDEIWPSVKTFNVSKKSIDFGVYSMLNYHSMVINDLKQVEQLNRLIDKNKIIDVIYDELSEMISDQAIKFKKGKL